MYSSIDVHNHLQDLDIPHEIFKISRQAGSMEQAAAALGLKLEQLARVEIYRSDAGPVMVVIPGNTEVDQSKLKGLTGSDNLEKMSLEEISSITGYHGNSVPPFLHKTEMPVYIDYYTLREDVIYTGSGDPASILKIRSYDLVRATGGEIADVVIQGEDRPGNRER